VRRNRSSIRDILTSYVALLRAVNVGGKTPSSVEIERHNRAKPGIYSAAPFKPQNLTEREDHEHEYLSRCFPWQQNQPENGGMDGPSRRATAGK
jgi:hypothetical protein